MIKYLRDAKCIDFSRLLLLRSKELGLSDNECHIVLLVMTLKDIGIKTITPQLLLEYSDASNKQIDEVLTTLVKKKWISNRLGSISLEEHVEEWLIQEKEEIKVEQTQNMNMIEIFERELGRSLSPMELQTICEWQESFGYQEDMIIMALKEAVKSQILSFRYIEGILNNWSKHGVSRRYVGQEEQEEEEITTSTYEWWKV